MSVMPHKIMQKKINNNQGIFASYLSLLIHYLNIYCIIAHEALQMCYKAMKKSNFFTTFHFFLKFAHVALLSFIAFGIAIFLVVYYIFRRERRNKR